MKVKENRSIGLIVHRPRKHGIRTVRRPYGSISAINIGATLVRPYLSPILLLRDSMLQKSSSSLAWTPVAILLEKTTYTL